MKRIFVSQSSLEMGRNRNHRTLDAKLDALLPKTIPDNSEFCDYIEDCNKACFKNTGEYNHCKIRKSKDKYKNGK